MNQPLPPPPGRIDLHCHLLPGVDDGCRSFDETLACVAQMQQRGFIGSVVTPHIWPHEMPHNTPDALNPKIEALRDQLYDNGVEYELWPGGEVRILPDIIEWMQAHGVPALAGTQYVLVDFWGSEWPQFVDEALQWLIEQQYRPIMAHPERINLNDQDRVWMVEHLAEMGVLLQGNFNCFGGGEGSQAMLWAKRWLREGRYDLLAMDLHRMDATEGRFEGLASVEIDLGPEGLAALIEVAPWQVLCDEPLR